MSKTPEQLVIAINAYHDAVGEGLGLPWSVHLEHFGGEMEPSMWTDHNTGEEKPGYHRQVVWVVKDSEGKHVHAGPNLAPLQLTDSEVFDECVMEHPCPEKSPYRKRLQHMVDAMNAVVAPCRVKEGRASV